MKRVFSGIQPSGIIHLGNYLGAIVQWVNLHRDHDCIFCVVDLHAITTPQDPKQLSKNIYRAAATYLAAGVDAEKSAIFIQSHRPEHAELSWIINTFTSIGELKRMTQYKSKSKILLGKDVLKISDKYGEKNLEYGIKKEYDFEPRNTKNTLDPENSILAGLFSYPTLMAADILLYQTDVVPVGEDQKQHVELTRNLAQRFNNKYGETFKVPEVLMPPQGKRIMGLDDPTKKMSKSAASEYNYIALTDSADTIAKKISRAVTDSGTEIRAGDDKPAITNLLNIFSLLSDTSVDDLEKRYAGKTYAEFKKDLTEVAIDKIVPIGNNITKLEKDVKQLHQLLDKGAKKVEPLARQTLDRVRDKLGLI